MNDLPARKRPPSLTPVSPIEVAETSRRVPVAEYVRMSTDHQQYSTANQTALIRRYAEEHDMEVIRTYADAGKSGLSMRQRAALSTLLADVVAGAAPFCAVLVYDVSRWGRFQDTDESAHYEFICRCAGIRVIYCAEQFSNDGSPVASVMKALKRAMAGEYSRELSEKVFAGQSQLVRMGYRLGGYPGYGLRRQLLEDGKTPGLILRYKQRKSIQTDRVILVPGPPEEVAIVRRIYREYIYLRRNEREITDGLNTDGIVDTLGKRFTRHKVETVLTNEKYIGNSVFNQHTAKLKSKHRKVDPAEWIRHVGAFQPIVSTYLFEAAKKIREHRTRRLTNDEILAGAREILRREGVLNRYLINAEHGYCSCQTIRARFGGVSKFYAHIGYVPGPRYRFHEIDRRLRDLKREQSDLLVLGLNASRIAVAVTLSGIIKFGKNEATLELVMSRCRCRGHKELASWRFNFDRNLGANQALVIRMTRDNLRILDFLLLTKEQVQSLPLFIDERNEHLVSPFRSTSLRSVLSKLKHMTRHDE